MNKVILIGRLCGDPEVRWSQGENKICIARYRLAVDRKRKKEEKQEADFIPCVALGSNGEFAEKYLKKGMKVAVEGRIQTGSYEKDGVKRYTTDIIVESQEFCEKKEAAGGIVSPAPQPDADGFMNIQDGIDEELPFL